MQKYSSSEFLSPKRLLVGLGCVVALAVAAPVLIVAASPLLKGDGTWQHLFETVLGDYVSNSVLLAAGSLAGAGTIGVVTAWLITMYAFPGRRILSWVLLLPLAMPTYLIAYAYTDFLDYAGPVQTWIRSAGGFSGGDYWFPSIRSLGGAIVLFSLVLYPYVYLLCRASFVEQSVSLLDASRTMGISRRRTFWRTALPLARPAFVAGLALVAMESLADYGAVDYFAVDTFTTGIYRAWFGLGSPIAAAQLSAALLGFILLLLFLERISRGGKRFVHTGNRRGDLARWETTKTRKMIALSVCLAPVLLGFGVPVGILTDAAVSAGLLSSLAESMEWARHSFILALVTATVAVPLALLLVYNTRIAPGGPARTAARIASMGYAIPGSIIAVGVLLALGWVDYTLQTVFSSDLFLAGTLGALVFAYLTRFLTLPVQAMDAGLVRISPSLDQAARTLRAGPLSILGRIHFPLLRTSTLAAGILVFVEVLKELPATLIIRPFNFDTLAVRVYQLASDERFNEAAAPALLIVLTGLVPVLLLNRMIESPRKNSIESSESRSF